MISVVFSAINCATTANLAVTSTLASLGANGEVIFHLDPSSDDSSSVLREIRDPRLRIIETRDRLGFADGLNLAISKAKFDLVARMDADDICLPWRFSRQLSVFKKTNSDVLFSTAIVFGRSVAPFGFFPQLPNRLKTNEVSAELSLRNPFVHPTMLCKKKALSVVSGYRNVLAEDYDLYLRFASNGIPMSRDYLPTILYRIHPGQATYDSSSWQSKVSSDPQIKNSLTRLNRQLKLAGEGGEPSTRKALILERKGLKGIVRRPSRQMKDSND